MVPTLLSLTISTSVLMSVALLDMTPSLLLGIQQAFCYTSPCRAGGGVGNSKPPMDQEAAPVSYRARQRAAAGEGDPFVVLADGQVDHGSAGETPIHGPAQVYRFKLRGADGKPCGAVIVIGAPAETGIAIHLEVQDEKGRPHRSRPFEIVAAGKKITGTTNAEGAVKATIPAAERARITIQGEHGAHTFTLHVEHL